jgi:SAM-dependent methyltransferase
MTSESYDQDFYDAQRDLSLRSAQQIVPLVLRLLAPTSVVDVGCGVGTWLRAFVDQGVTDVTGVEGAYVRKFALEIDDDALVVADLSSGSLELPRTFDLAVSMEVAEHLSEQAARPFVRSLTTLAPAVLFGAAVPSQGGDGHVNEQWQHWWSDRFAENGYVAYDVIRPHVWSNPDVAWWYAQNTILYVRAGDPVEARVAESADRRPLSIVHPAMLLERVAASEAVPLGTSVQLLRSAVARAIGARVQRNGREPRPATSRHTTLERLHDIR